MRIVSSRVVVSLAVVTALFAAGCGSSGTKPAMAPTAQTTSTTATKAATRTAKKSAASEILFVVQGRHGRAVRQGNAWTLTIDVNSAPVVWFTDRPLRRSSRLSPEKFVAEWVRNGFRDDPPNAAFTGVDGSATFDLVVELRDPHWNATAHTMTFTVTPLDRKATLPASVDDDVSLFVDAAQNTINLNITNLTQIPLQIQSASPDISTWTSSQSPGIGYDFGEGSSNGPSVNMGYTSPNPGVGFIAQLILVGPYNNVWQLQLQWDGNGNPSANITRFSGQGMNLLGQQATVGTPVALANLNPDDGQTANYQIVFIS